MMSRFPSHGLFLINVTHVSVSDRKQKSGREIYLGPTKSRKWILAWGWDWIASVSAVPPPRHNFPLENEKERINISWQPNPQGAGSSLFSYTSHGAEESFQDDQSQSWPWSQWARKKIINESKSIGIKYPIRQLQCALLQVWLGKREAEIQRLLLMHPGANLRESLSDLLTRPRLVFAWYREDLGCGRYEA